jgi:ABC-type transporter Mla MlaB component
MAAESDRTVAFCLGGRVGRDQLTMLCSRLGGLLEETGAATALCDVSAVQADAVAVEALARLDLAARRHGCRLRLTHPSPALRRLLTFTGLECLLSGALFVEPGRQPEEREEDVRP